jgi:hypothetical protein
MRPKRALSIGPSALLVPQLRREAVRAHPSVVDQDQHRPEALLEGPEELVRGILGAQVALQEVGLSLRPLDLGCDPLGPLGVVAVADAHRPAVRGQPTRDRRPDSAGGSGDQGAAL